MASPLAVGHSTGRASIPPPPRATSVAGLGGRASAAPTAVVSPAASQQSSWVNVSALSPLSPPSSALAAMAYDAADGYELLFGGLAHGVPLGETWVYKDFVWENLTASLNPSPSPRYGAAFEYEGSGQRILLFGGQDSATHMLGDTWSFSAGAWTNLSGSIGKPPSPRTGASFAYDVIDKESVLFGGTNGTAERNDTWTFSGGLWHPATPTVAPPVRIDASFGWDPTGNDLLLFGGSTMQGSADSDTWVFQGGSWTELGKLVKSPSARELAGGVLDPSLNAFLLFGGYDPSSCVPLQDSWTFSAGAWNVLPVSAPSPRDGAAMGVDTATGFNVMFGGYVDPGCVQHATTNSTYVYGNWVPVVYTPLDIITHTGVISGPAPLAVAPFIQVTGGFPPYNTIIDWGDGTSPTFGDNVAFLNVTHTYNDSGNYALNITATDSAGHSVSAVYIASVGTELVANWLPSRDTYPFHNPVTYWSTGGNCYGVSSTEILYWEHDIEGWPTAPELPQVGATSTSQLSLPTDPVNDLNPTALALLDHQTHDPGNLDLPIYYLSSNLGMWYGNVENDLNAHEPSLISLGNSNLHAVIVYGEQTFANGTVEFDISDPNVPLSTTHAWYEPSSHSFNYTTYGTTWNEFAQTDGMNPSPLRIDWFYPYYDPFEWGTDLHTSSSDGIYFITGGEPLTVFGPAGADWFTVPGASQSFVEGIANSTGVSESNVESFAVPNLSSSSYTIVDPSNGTSSLSVLLATNTSGLATLRGFDLTLNSSGEHTFNATPGVNQLTVRLGAEPLEAAVSLHYLSPAGNSTLNASGLDFPASSTVTFLVTDWSQLNGSSPPVTVQVVEPNGVVTNYSLRDGQVGLAPAPSVGSSPSASPAFYDDAAFYGGLGVGVVAAVAVAVVLFRKPRTPAPQGPPPSAL
jgi:hypothetical protein